MTRRWIILLAWAAVAILAAWLRLESLSLRPMHADEATGARILSQRLGDQGYSFDPTHFHGPTLSLLAAPVARLRGETSWEDLSAGTLRLVPAIAGILLVFAPLLVLRAAGPWPPLAAAALLAVSPLLVYYSRMFIHELLLALFAMAALGAMLRLLRRPTAPAGLLLGAALGLMWATKASFVIAAFSWAVAAAAVMLASGPAGLTDQARKLPVPTLLAALSATAVAVLLNTDFLHQPGAALDTFRTFFTYQTGAGHDKPAGYFAALLLRVEWPAALLAALAAAAVLLRRGIGQEARRLALFLALSTLVQLLVYSLIAYKTPWLMVVPWTQLCLLGGLVLAAPAEGPPRAAVGPVLALAACTLLQLRATLQWTGSAYPRNPYAYVQTSPDVEKMAAWLEQVDALIAPGTIRPVAVLGSQYWPLPWYLRPLGPAGYWPEADPQLAEAAVVIAMPDRMEAAQALLAPTHTGLPRGLREDTPVMLFLRNDVWQRWMEAPAP